MFIASQTFSPSQSHEVSTQKCLSLQANSPSLHVLFTASTTNLTQEHYCLDNRSCNATCRHNLFHRLHQDNLKQKKCCYCDQQLLLLFPIIQWLPHDCHQLPISNLLQYCQANNAISWLPNNHLSSGYKPLLNVLCLYQWQTVWKYNTQWLMNIKIDCQ